MKLSEWIALLLTLAFVAMILGHSSGVVNVEKWVTNAGAYLINAVTLNGSSAPSGIVSTSVLSITPSLGGAGP